MKLSHLFNSKFVNSFKKLYTCILSKEKNFTMKNFTQLSANKNYRIPMSSN